MLGFFLARLAYDHWWGTSSVLRQLPPREGRFCVVSVVDGNTLVVREEAAETTGSKTVQPVPVRLLGIDSGKATESDEQSKSWVAESCEFIERFVAGHTVRLRFDKRRIDPSGCYLAYVFVEDRLLNEALVQAGLARVATHPGDSLSMARRLRVAEREARDQLRGMWASTR